MGIISNQRSRLKSNSAVRPDPYLPSIPTVSDNMYRDLDTQSSSVGDTYDQVFSSTETAATSPATQGLAIGLLSAFGSAALVGLVILVIYLFRNTSRGRIWLDRIGRPGEYDDEQALAREEAEALELMDEISRQEYFRAKGKPSYFPDRE